MKYVVPCLVCGLVFVNGAAADIVPVSRTTALSASWYQGGGPFGPVGDGVSDGSTSFAPYSNSLSSGGGSASQSSYLVALGAYASVSATGSQNGSVMQPAGSGGSSAFTYVFDLTDPTTLFFNGSLGRSFITSVFGTVRLYDDTTNTLLYQPVFPPDPFTMSFNFSDTYAAAAGRYRLEIRAVNNGNGAAIFSQTSTASALMTTPTPGVASLFAATGLIAVRRRRS